MPSFRWKVTMETNPGKDDVSKTSARTTSICPRWSLRRQTSSWIYLQEEQKYNIIIIFFGVCDLSCRQAHRKINSTVLWWQLYIHALQLVIKCTSRHGTHFFAGMGQTKVTQKWESLTFIFVTLYSFSFSKTILYYIIGFTQMHSLYHHKVRE